MIENLLHTIYTNSKGVTYHLCTKQVELKNDMNRPIFFFAKSTDGRAAALIPDDKEIKETKNGLPVLKKKKME